MRRIVRELKISSLVLLGGILVPVMLSIAFSGFRIDIISIVNYIFFTGLLIAMIGGIMMISGYSRFKRRVLKTPSGDEIEKEADDKINWANVLFYTGIVIVLGAVGIGEIF